MIAPIQTASDSSALTPLCDATNAMRFGRKAAALAELLQAGFDVPDGFVLAVDASPSLGEIESALARLGSGPVAVRSSGVSEDLEDASCAGYYTSVVNVLGAAAVLGATQQVLASAKPKATTLGIQTAPMAVLVQTMVPADAAGVAFSANPRHLERGAMSGARCAWLWAATTTGRVRGFPRDSVVTGERVVAQVRGGWALFAALPRDS